MASVINSQAVSSVVAAVDTKSLVSIVADSKPRAVVSAVPIDSDVAIEALFAAVETNGYAHPTNTNPSYKFDSTKPDNRQRLQSTKAIDDPDTVAAGSALNISMDSTALVSNEVNVSVSEQAVPDNVEHYVSKTDVLINSNNINNTDSSNIHLTAVSDKPSAITSPQHLSFLTITTKSSAPQTSPTYPHHPPNPSPTLTKARTLSASHAASKLSSPISRRPSLQKLQKLQPPNSRPQSNPETTSPKPRGARPSAIYPRAKAAEDTLGRKGLASSDEVVRIVSELKLPDEEVYSSDSDDEGAMAASESSQLSDEIADLKRKLRAAHEHMEDVSALHSETIAQYEAQANELRAEVGARRKEITRLEVAERTRGETDDELRQMVMEMKSESDMYKKRCMQLRQDLEFKSNELQVASSHLTETRIELQVARSTITRLTSQRDNDLLQSTRLIERMQQDHNETIRRLEEENSGLAEQLHHHLSECGDQHKVSKAEDSPNLKATNSFIDGFESGDVDDVELPARAGVKSLESELADCVVPEIPDVADEFELPVLDALAISHAAIISGCLVGGAAEVERICQHISPSFEDRGCMWSYVTDTPRSLFTSPDRHSDRPSGIFPSPSFSLVGHDSFDSLDSLDSPRTMVNVDLRDESTVNYRISVSGDSPPRVPVSVRQGAKGVDRARKRVSGDFGGGLDHMASKYVQQSGARAVGGGGSCCGRCGHAEGKDLWAAMRELGIDTNVIMNNISGGNEPIGHTDLRVIDDVVGGLEDRVRLKFLMRSALWRLQDKVKEEQSRLEAVERENRRLREAVASAGAIRRASIGSAKGGEEILDLMLREVYG